MAQRLDEVFGFSTRAVVATLNCAARLCYKRPIEYNPRIVLSSECRYKSGFPPTIGIVPSAPQFIGLFSLAIGFTIPAEAWRINVGRGPRTVGVSVLVATTAISLLFHEWDFVTQLRFWARADREIASPSDLCPSPAGAVLSVLRMAKNESSFAHLRDACESATPNLWGPMPAPEQHIPSESYCLDSVRQLGVLIERASIQAIEGGAR